MSKETKTDSNVTTQTVDAQSEAERIEHRKFLDALHKADNRLLAELGYRPEFKREFSVSLQVPLLVD